jgi:hypothetical protein
LGQRFGSIRRGIIVEPGPVSCAPACNRPDTVARQAAPKTAAPKVVIVVVDALRADHLGCYGYPSETTPGNDRIRPVRRWLGGALSVLSMRLGAGGIERQRTACEVAARCVP